MSDFKIARLKYTWKGNWVAGVEYKPDDVVALGGKAYSCLLRHESQQNFFSDLNFVNNDTPPAATPRWIQIADGVRFVGDWQTNNFYAVGDIVAFSGGLYICELDHTSAEEESGFDNDYTAENRWTIFVTTDNWSQEWQTSTYYGIGSVIRYNARVYRSKEGHISSSIDNPGLLEDIEKWELVAASVNWTDDWQDSNLYKTGDLARYGGRIYKCINQHGSGGTLINNLSDWELVVDGIEYLGNWTALYVFKENDIVKYGAYLYICIQEHQSSSVFDDTKWNVYCPGNQYEHLWDDTTIYTVGDIVRHGGYVYVSVIGNLNSAPTYDQGVTNPNWRLLFDGTRIAGEWSSASSYLPGDIVRRGANVYVAVTEVPAGQDTDLLEDGSTINSDYWKELNTGSLWKSNWTSDERYILGDVVIWQGASYKCVAKHTADLSKRPDNDDGSYWANLLYGDPRNVLSLPGDIKYFSSGAETNLSIGLSGQTLKVSNSAPVWNSFSASQNVYYVSLDGIDHPSRGSTPQSSFRTVRYALDHITGPATLFVRTGTFDEILPLRIPANVAVVGDELRSTVIKPAENYFSSDDIDNFDNILTFLLTLLPDIITASPVVSQFGPAFIKQDVSGSPGTITQANAVIVNLNNISGSMAVGNQSGISTNTISAVAAVLNSALQLENNLLFIQSEVKSWLQITYPSYSFDDNMIDTVVERILNALAYDLRYPGDYKSIETGTYFYNGANPEANKLSNMFLMGNATGLRNMTLVGLEGELGPFNQYLTQRPTAGAYASLDPGWGPEDNSVWITSRSPYVQNVTTFGEACVGLKVDGDLHDGGNRTIVCNDFTQILSDGIGVWCNGEGASEAVSVFTYYNHIGYLCTAGGKIRGTNGNCSYGKYGCVAEEFDLTETPITATINTRFFDASVGQVFTNGNEILQVFYSNAGQNYTNATMTATGAGINASLLPEEFRDGSIFEARVANPNDSTTPGGSGYTTSINNAQAGDPYYIQLSAADVQNEAAYQNLRLVINSGTGAGQYGYVAAFDESTKIALIADERFSTYEITETLSTGNKVIIDILNRDATFGEYQFKVGDRVCFTGDEFGSLTKYTVYVISDFSSAQLELEDELGNPVVVTDDTGSMTMHVLGFSHFSIGTPAASTLDTTTSYQIEPRLIFDLPTRDVSPVSVTTTGTWTCGAYGNDVYVLVQTGPASIALYSTTGSSWSEASIPSGNWTKVAYGNGIFVAVSSDGKAISSPDGETWTELTVPNYEYASIVYGNGVWIAVASGGTNAIRSIDAVTWTDTTLPEGADWKDIAYGKGKFVAVAESDSTVTSTAYTSDGGLTWNLGSFLGGCVAITFGNNRFVAIEGGYGGAEKSFISFDGITWTSSTLPEPTNYSDIAYGQGHFIACSSTVSSSFYYSEDGLRWNSFNPDDINGASTFVFFGNAGSQPRFFLGKTGNVLLSLEFGTRAQGRTVTSSGRLNAIRLWNTGSNYLSTPNLEIFDPNNVADAFIEIRTANGVLGPPTILDAGEGWITVSTRIAVEGDGFKDEYPVGNTLIVDNATRIPGPGDNLRINGIDDYVYRVLSAEVINGTLGNYRLRMRIGKSLDVNEAPIHNTSITIRQKYSQVRVTGHDFLDIGLGNFQQTNYPDTLFPNGTVLSSENEVLEENGGRVFYTSTDQDGNFRVGELFAVEQATGTVTINADNFELGGLEELSIGGISVGGTGVVIREFSTDPLFVADSNNILSTQRAVKAYLERRVSGGGSDAFTAQFTAGIVRVGPSAISTTTLDAIQIPVKVQFNAPVDGYMLAQTYFLSGDGFHEG